MHQRILREKSQLYEKTPVPTIDNHPALPYTNLRFDLKGECPMRK